jgi:hypothetical protein
MVETHVFVAQVLPAHRGILVWFARRAMGMRLESFPFEPNANPNPTLARAASCPPEWGVLVDRSKCP